MSIIQQYDPRIPLGGTGPSMNGVLPFQQIDPNAYGNVRQNPDILLAQRLNERNTLDVAVGGRPQGMPGMPGMQPTFQGGYQQPQQSHFQGQQQQMPNYQGGYQQMPNYQGGYQQQQMPNYQMSGDKTTSLAHPSHVQWFLGLDPMGQQQVALTNRVLYDQILMTIQRQNRGQLGEPEPPKREDEEETHSVHSSESNESEKSTNKDHASRDVQEDKESRKSHRKDHKDSKDRKDRREKKDRRDKKTFTLPKVNDEPVIEVSSKHRRDTFLSLDFRRNLIETIDNQYLLLFDPVHNVTTLELVSCILPRSAALEREPYVLLRIANIAGSYEDDVFGKLVQEKISDDFIIYKPENCICRFIRPIRIDRLCVSFLRFDQTPMSLNKIQVTKIKRIKEPSGAIKVTAREPHYLSNFDRVAISNRDSNDVSVDIVDVITTLGPDTFILDAPLHQVTTNANIGFEKPDIKCTMTFRC